MGAGRAQGSWSHTPRLVSPVLPLPGCVNKTPSPPVLNQLPVYKTGAITVRGWPCCENEMRTERKYLALCMAQRE